MSRQVLLIEDNPEIQQSLCETLQEKGYDVSTLCDSERALASVDEWAQQFQLVIIEESIHGRSGLDLMHEAHQRRRSLPIVIITREGDWSGYARALSEGALSYLQCPVDRRELLTTIEEALAATV